MKKLIALFLSIARILCAVPAVSAQTAVAEEPIRILAIGNSFSNNSTHFIDVIAKSLGVEVEAYSLYYPGCTIKQHVNFYNNEKTEYALSTEGEKRKYYFSPSETANYSFSVTGEAEVIFNIYENGRMKGSYDGAFSHKFLCGGGYEIVVECTNNPSDFSFTAQKQTGSGGGADVGVVFPTELIIVSEPNKKTYEVGEELDLTGLKVAIKYSDGSLMALIGGYEISGFYPDQAAIQKITLTAEGVSNSFNIQVFEKAGYEVGDVDGNATVNAADLAVLKKVIAKLLSPEEVANPDVDGEGDIPNAADLALLKKIVAGIL